MRRRELILALGSTTLVRPKRALAESGAKLPLVAVLYPGPEQLFKSRWAAVRDGLKDEGPVVPVTMPLRPA